MQTRELVLIFGRVGSGKTTLSQKISNALSKKFGLPLIAFDLNHEHDGLVALGAKQVEDFLCDGEMKIAYRIDEGSEDIFEEMNEVFRVAWEYGDVILLVDEAEFFIGSRDYNTRKSFFLRCVQFGRHRRIHLVCCARNVVELNIMVRAQFTRVITFKQVEPLGLGRLERIGFEPKKILELKQYKYLTIEG